VKAKDRVLAVHYHAPFHIDAEGKVFIVSFIGLWLEALASCWREVVYIGHRTASRRREQDHIVRCSNVRFVSAGEPGGMLSLIRRVRGIKKAVDENLDKVDALIVRAPTARQGTIIRIFGKANKALYLVGEPPERSLSFAAKAGPMGILMEFLNRRRQRQTTRLAKGCLVVANSVELCRRYGERLGKEIFYSPSSSLTEEDFHHADDRCLGEHIRLLFVGRVCRDKGIPELLESVRLMKLEGRKVILDVVGGSGDADRIEIFTQMCVEKKIGDVVVWNGRVPFGPELFRFYREADILILPSRHEGFPRVIQEAMANGVLVLVTNVGGIADVCKHERELYFIERTPESIAAAVERLASDQRLRKCMLDNGYRFAREHLAGENERKLTRILEEHWS